MKEKITKEVEEVDILTSLFRSAKKVIKTFTVPSTNDVMNELKNIPIKRNQSIEEKTVEKIVAAHLHNVYQGGVHQQYNIGGYLGLKVDIDLFNGGIGIEIKLASQLKSSSIERLFGQVIYYSKRLYNAELIVLIVGTKKEYNEIIKEIEKFVKELQCSFVYLETK